MHTLDIQKNQKLLIISMYTYTHLNVEFILQIDFAKTQNDAEMIPNVEIQPTEALNFSRIHAYTNTYIRTCINTCTWIHACILMGILTCIYIYKHIYICKI